MTTEATLSRWNIRKLLEIAGQRICEKCRGVGMVPGPRDYLRDRIGADCPECKGNGFVPK
jgi:DnaJ-class molecular chaperone